MHCFTELLKGKQRRKIYPINCRNNKLEKDFIIYLQLKKNI